MYKLNWSWKQVYQLTVLLGYASWFIPQVNVVVRVSIVKRLACAARVHVKLFGFVSKCCFVLFSSFWHLQHLMVRRDSVFDLPSSIIPWKEKVSLFIPTNDYKANGIFENVTLKVQLRVSPVLKTETLHQCNEELLSITISNNLVNDEAVFYSFLTSVCEI